MRAAMPYFALMIKLSSVLHMGKPDDDDVFLKVNQ